MPASASTSQWQLSSRLLWPSVHCICTAASLWTMLQTEAITAQALAELQRRLQSCPHGQGDEETQKWFLRDRKLDVGEAEQKLTDMLRWRQEFK